MKMFVAICFGYWGRGETEEAALAQCRKAGGKKKAETFVYRVDTPVEVAGDTCWLLDEGGKRLRSFDAIDELKPYVDGIGNVCYFGQLTQVAKYVKGVRVQHDEAAA